MNIKAIQPSALQLCARAVTPFLLAMLPAIETAAVTCQINESPSLNFGEGAPGEARGTYAVVRLQCTNSSLLPSVAKVEACLFVGEGTPTGVRPRRMYNGAGAYLNYDIYADAGNIRMIGPFGSNYTPYSLRFEVPSSSPQEISFPIHGRVHSGQSVPATSAYQGQPSGSMVSYSFTHGIFAPADGACLTGKQALFSWSGVHARIANTCHISQTTNMDFGESHGLATAQKSTSSITLSCTPNTAWTATLDDGTHASAGQRFMSSGANRIAYELYSDPARQQRWGNTDATGVSGTGTGTPETLTVHGLVPASPGTRQGSYEDIVTVTLTY